MTREKGIIEYRHWSNITPRTPWRLDIKINVDAAVGPRFSTITAVVRDWRGELVFAGSMKVNTTLPLQAKAEAIKWAISLAPALAGKSVIVETDSQSVVQLLSNLAVPPPWRIKSSCSDLRSLLSLSGNVSVIWVPRLCNEAAHTLAKWCLSCNIFGSFGCGYSPGYFSSVILGESSRVL